MSDQCDLKAANGIVAHCDGERCAYWRVVEHLGVTDAQDGCAIRHFQLLDDERSAEIAAWLLSVKERVDSDGKDLTR